MYDATKTKSYSLRANFPDAVIPDLGLGNVFSNKSTTIAVFLAILVAILIWFIIDKTTFGYELKACGHNKDAARYAGINEKRNIILSMVIAGALAGFGAGLYYLSGVAEWNPQDSTACPALALTVFPLPCWRLPTPSARFSPQHSSPISPPAAALWTPTCSRLRSPT